MPKFSAHEILSVEHDAFTWLEIDSDTHIMRVVGGWILRSRFVSTWGVSVTQTFMPDTRK
jgi:hypothetical protein